MISNPIGNSVVNLFSILSGSSATGVDPTRRPQDTPLSAIAAAQPRDKVDISPEALEAAKQVSGTGNVDTSKASVGATTVTDAETSTGGRELSEEDQQALRDLQQRDAQVRAHEQAHLGAAGGTAGGGPSFTFQTGPDGRRYAVGGEVPIQVTSGSDDPQERIQHAEQVRRAALAPSEPSPADLSIASQASQEIAAAQAELRTQQSETPESTGGEEGTGEGPGGLAGVGGDTPESIAVPGDSESDAAIALPGSPTGEPNLVGSSRAQDDGRESSFRAPNAFAPPESVGKRIDVFA